MATLDETKERWFGSQPINGVRFGLNDSVRVTSEPPKGRLCSVIALTSLEPVTYLVELAVGGDVELRETELEPQN
jgi:hypothetical protein